MIKIMALFAVLGSDGGVSFEDTTKYGKVRCFTPLNLNPEVDVYEKTTLNELILHTFNTDSYLKIVYFTTCNTKTKFCRNVSSDSMFCYFEG